MRPTSVKLPEALDRRLTDLAHRRGMSRSALLRQAIEGLKDKDRTSVTAAAAGLVGSLSGPRDLSSSSRHMNGYGK